MKIAISMRAAFHIQDKRIKPPSLIAPVFHLIIKKVAHRIKKA